MNESNFLCAYRDVSGIEQVLSRIGRRFRRPVDLCPAIADLRNHYALLHEDFRRFFPELQEHIASFSTSAGTRGERNRPRTRHHTV